MTTLREAAQRALDEIADARDYIWLLDEGGIGISEEEILDKIANAITALRAALADGDNLSPTEPVQEPVAVVRSVVSRGEDGVNIKWLRGFPQIGDRLYTAPPQRKPLTEEEIEDLYFDKFSMGELKAFARAIEQAHGIKE